MLLTLPWLTIVSLSLPASVSGASPAARDLCPAPQAVFTSTPPRVARDSAPVLLTADLIKNYLAVRQDVFAFLVAHPDVAKATPTRQYTIPLRGPSGKTIVTQPVRMTDFVVLAAKDSQVATMFKQHHLEPAQFAPVTVALRQALFAAAFQRAADRPIQDPQSVASKNLMLAEQHHSELASTGLDYKMVCHDHKCHFEGNSQQEAGVLH